MTHKNAITEARDALVKAADVNGSLGGDYPLMKQCETAIAKLDALIAAAPDITDIVQAVEKHKSENPTFKGVEAVERVYKAAKILHETIGETHD